MTNTQRKWAVIGAVVVLLALAVMNVGRAVGRLQPGPAVGASAGPHVPDFVPQTPSASDPFTFTSMGSAVPDALSDVGEWIIGRPRAASYSPAAYEAAVEAPAPAQLEITGTGTTPDSGPTEQDVEVPTNQGDLMLIMQAVDGKWICTSLDWE
jgi:hypothetical protein